jgi:hypothetical protein
MSSSKHTYTYSRLGVGDVAVLAPEGHPYTMSSVLPAGWEASFWYTDDRLASVRDQSKWAQFNGVNVPSAAVKIAVNIDLIPTLLPDSAKAKVTISTNNYKAAPGLQYTNSGGHSISAVAEDEYANLVIGDIAGGEALFWTFHDGQFDPARESGTIYLGDTEPSEFFGGPISVDPNPPWPGAVAIGSQHDDGVMWGSPAGIAPSVFKQEFLPPGFGSTHEVWMRFDQIGGNVVIMQMFATDSDGINFIKDTNDNITFTFDGPNLDLPPEWAPSTAYAQGDRVTIVSGGTIQEAEVGGTSAGTEPTWPAMNDTVVDNDITWRNFGLGINQFHNSFTYVTPSVETVSINTWNHYVLVRDSVTGEWRAYIDGVEVTSLAVAADDTTPGSFGSPKPFEISVNFDGVGRFGFPGHAFKVGAGTVFASLTGALAYPAFYWRSLTPAEILAHYNKGVELGLVIP